MLTVQYAKAVPQVKINAVEPGITATSLGGADPGSDPGVPPRQRTVVAQWAGSTPTARPAPSRKTSANSAAIPPTRRTERLHQRPKEHPTSRHVRSPGQRKHRSQTTRRSRPSMLFDEEGRRPAGIALDAS